MEQFLHQSQLCAPADELGLQPVDPLRTAYPDSTRPARHNGTGSAFPFNGVRTGVREGDRRLNDPPGRLVDQTAPGSAAACTRAAVFTGSPATIP